MKTTNKLKRIGSFLTIFALVGIITTGCGKSSTTSESTKPAESTAANAEATTAPTAAPQKGVTIVVASSAGWTKDIDKKLAEQFKAETGNTIEFSISPDDQYVNVLKTKFATGEGPDVYLTQGGVSVAQFQPDQHALDLSNEPWVPRYTDWAKAGTTYNGKVIALNTWSVDGWGILYNSTVFDQAGLKVPTNYQEFLNVSEALKAKGITPIYEPGKAEWHQEVWVNSFSAGIAKKTAGIYDQFNTNTAKFADQKDLETSLTQLKEIADKGYFGKDYMAQTWENSVDAMGSGKYAMMLTYSTFSNEVIAKFPSSKADTWGMFPVPLNDNTVWATSAGGIVRSINKDSKVIDAAKAYFNFLAKPENLKSYYAERPDLGPISFKDVEGKTTHAYSSIMENAKGGTVLDFEGGILYWNVGVVGKSVQDLYLGGKTPKQVLEAIDTDREKSFK